MARFTGRFCWCSLALVLGSSRIAAAERVEPEMLNAAGLEFDDDSLNIVHHTDRNYTAGGFASFSGRWVDKAYLTAPIDAFDWLFQTRRAYDWLDRASPQVFRGYDFTFAATLYTPEDLRDAVPIRSDHPYANLMSLFVSHTSFSDTLRMIPGLPGGLAISSDFTLGALGTAVGRDLQSWVHLVIRGGVAESCTPNNAGLSPPQPCGWNNQISNGGEPTLLYGVHAQQLLIGRELAPYLWFDAKMTGDASLGYQVTAAAGAEFRLGLIQTPFWWSLRPPLTVGARSGPLPQHRLPYGIELYWWVAVGGQLVAYNALLEGQFRSSAVRVVAEPLVADFETGLMLNIWIFRFSWAPFTGRSPDFFGDPEGPHVWTAITAAVHFVW
jgi:hypothetical protein